MQIELQGQQQGIDQHIPSAPVFEQHDCHVELVGWACLHCGSSVENIVHARTKNLATAGEWRNLQK